MKFKQKMIKMVKKGNMYGDSVKQWNPFVGCEFDCVYCRKSFQAQMKRQLHNCMDCYNYRPHFHSTRLRNYLPKTEGDQFIFTCSSSDISFIKSPWMSYIILRIKELDDRKFLIQTKQPNFFKQFVFPDNVHLGITLETNRDIGYSQISKAPLPTIRARNFLEVDHESKFVTIEPILDFDLDEFVFMLSLINPERIYIGYDTKKNNLKEPSLNKTNELIEELKKITTVKLKLIREANNV